MNDRPRNPQSHQLDLYDTDGVRSLLDQLLEDSKLYTKSKDFKELLDFVVRLRNFAPFNAMLLQVQKPALSYAASARDWRERFGRFAKEGARPLLILWPFGPVAFVYDVLDTEGESKENVPGVFSDSGVCIEGGNEQKRRNEDSLLKFLIRDLLSLRKNMIFEK